MKFCLKVEDEKKFGSFTLDRLQVSENGKPRLQFQILAVSLVSLLFNQTCSTNVADWWKALEIGRIDCEGLAMNKVTRSIPRGLVHKCTYGRVAHESGTSHLESHLVAADFREKGYKE